MEGFFFFYFSPTDCNWLFTVEDSTEIKQLRMSKRRLGVTSNLFLCDAAWWNVLRVDKRIGIKRGPAGYLRDRRAGKGLARARQPRAAREGGVVLRKIKRGLTKPGTDEGSHRCRGRFLPCPSLTAPGQPKSHTYANQCHCYGSDPPPPKTYVPLGHITAG